MAQYYNREERLSQPGAPPPEMHQKTSLLKSRSLVILLVDGIILAAFVLVVLPMLTAPENSARVSGYQLLLRAEKIQGGVWAVLTVVKLDDRPPPAEALEVRFSATGRSQAGGVGVFHRLELPREKGQSAFIQEALSLDEAGASLQAELLLGSRRLHLSFDLAQTPAN